MDNQLTGHQGQFWLVVPLLSKQTHEIRPFINQHQWFFDQGGKAIFKISGAVDRDFASQVSSPNIHLIQRPDTGLYEAWNQSMDYLQDMEIHESSYIAFLGLDDVWSENFFSRALDLIKQQKNIDFIYGNSRHLFQGRYIDFASPIMPALFESDHFVFDVPHPGMLNKWGLILNQRFNTQFKLAADFDFYIGIAQKRKVSYKKINVNQADLGATGISNGPKAKSIYLKEWKQIEKKRGVKLSLQLWRTRLMALLAMHPYLFQIMRKLWWAVKATKVD